MGFAVVRILACISFALIAPLSAQAQISDDVVKIGVLTDLSGPASTPTGPGSVLAAQMAVDDFGGRIAGKPITVKLEEVGDVVRLSVADRGIGIAPDDVDRVFGRFQRAAPIRNYGGMGLGLYITRHIVEAHRGTISVASKPGEGSTFVVELPRLSASAAAGRDKVPRARA